ncbi:MAG: Flavohemoprotein [Candidatus Heimdallarchaeota archaeon LC_3]|nr:MAG: Flavohemoprotein [Candidatus Heimdallarchaeota archaeon LC_3]
MNDLNNLLFTSKEADILTQSLKALEEKTDDLPKLFYYHFLEPTSNKEIISLFNKSDMTKQYMMFHQSLAIIVSSIKDSHLLNQILKDLVKRHKNYGVKYAHVQIFSSAFYKTIEEIFPKDEKVKILWIKLINFVLSKFNEELES